VLIPFLVAALLCTSSVSGFVLSNGRHPSQQRRRAGLSQKDPVSSPDSTRLYAKIVAPLSRDEESVALTKEMEKQMTPECPEEDLPDFEKRTRFKYQPSFFKKTLATEKFWEIPIRSMRPYGVDIVFRARDAETNVRLRLALATDGEIVFFDEEDEELQVKDVRRTVAIVQHVDRARPDYQRWEDPTREGLSGTMADGNRDLDIDAMIENDENEFEIGKFGAGKLLSPELGLDVEREGGEEVVDVKTKQILRGISWTTGMTSVPEEVLQGCLDSGVLVTYQKGNHELRAFKVENSNGRYYIGKDQGGEIEKVKSPVPTSKAPFGTGDIRLLGGPRSFDHNRAWSFRARRKGTGERLMIGKTPVGEGGETGNVYLSVSSGQVDLVPSNEVEMTFLGENMIEYTREGKALCHVNEKGSPVFFLTSEGFPTQDLWEGPEMSAKVAKALLGSKLLDHTKFFQDRWSIQGEKYLNKMLAEHERAKELRQHGGIIKGTEWEEHYEEVGTVEEARKGDYDAQDKIRGEEVLLTGDAENDSKEIAKALARRSLPANELVELDAKEAEAELAGEEEGEQEEEDLSDEVQGFLKDFFGKNEPPEAFGDLRRIKGDRLRRLTKIYSQAPAGIERAAAEHMDEMRQWQSIQEFRPLELVLESKAVSKTLAGGRVRTFKTMVIVGDANGWIGIGEGKHVEFPQAYTMAIRNAFRNIHFVRITREGCLPHGVTHRYRNTKIILGALPAGTGVRASPMIKAFLEICGYRSAFCKHIGSKNVKNTIECLIQALESMTSLSERRAALDPLFDGSELRTFNSCQRLVDQAKLYLDKKEKVVAKYAKEQLKKGRPIAQEALVRRPPDMGKQARPEQNMAFV